MTHKNVLARLLHKAGWPTPVIVCVMSALKFDAPEGANPDYLGRKLWRFIAERCKEERLNTMAKVALDRCRTMVAMHTLHNDSIDVGDDQMTLDQLVETPWPIVDRTALPDVHQ